MSFDPNEWLPLYINIIREIRLRAGVIDYLLSDKSNLGPTPRYEFCHLELRMICELIAISSLVAHGDISETKTKRMRSTWEADKILSVMEKLRSDFFPIAANLDDGEDGLPTVTDSPYAIADRKEVGLLYRQCGQILHRGTLEKYDQIQTNPAQFEAISDWVAKFKALTDFHLIAGYGSDGLFLWLIALDDEHLPVVRKLNRIGDLPSEANTAQPDRAPPETENPEGASEAPK